MTDTPTITRDILDILQDDPATFDLTIDHLALPAMILDLDPSEWRDFGLDRPTDYSAGSSGQLGLYDLHQSAWATMKRTVLEMDWDSFDSDDDQDGNESLTGQR